MGNLTEALMEEHRRLQNDIEVLQKRKSETDKRLKDDYDRLALVEELLGPGHVPQNESREALQSPNRDITDIAVEILGEREKEPMHYKDLTKEVQARGGNLKTTNAPNVLVARLVSDGRFVRPTRRGYYALRSDYPDVKSVGARKQHMNSNNGQNKQ